MQHYKLDTDEQVRFYEQEFYPLSNFSSFTLQWKGIRFDTSEAAYHWEKFPHHPEVQEHIRLAASADAAYRVAFANKKMQREDWDDVKVEIMYEILFAKVQQHDYVAKKLRETGKRLIIEDSWRDSFWGWGPKMDGKNVLGKLWMKVRDSREYGLRQSLTNIL